MGKDSRKGKLRGMEPNGAATPPAGLARRYEGLVEFPAGAGGERVDRYISERLGILSRSQIKARGAVIRLNGRAAKLSAVLKGGERLVVEWTDEPAPDLVPEDLPLEVIHEDDRVVVVNKAQGMVTHPGHGNRRGTLANALMGRLASAASSSSESPAQVTNPVQATNVSPAASFARAGIVHRLDKDTSGVIIAAKDAEAQAFLAAQFKDRSTRKEYLAVTRGVPAPAAGRIENRLGRDRRDRKRFSEVAEGGKLAVTDYRVVAVYGPYALVALRPRTGRTHQLRVHLAGLGTPIVGDPIYGRPDRELPGATLMLHAFRLKIVLPGGAEPSLFRAPPPHRMLRLLALLEQRYGKQVPPRS
jgi:23S rRNA pseudouridine1911/1915/1917 synthase